MANPLQRLPQGHYQESSPGSGSAPVTGDGSGQPGLEIDYCLRCEFRNYLTKGFLDDLASDALTGLSSNHKSIPSKYFYDERGSQLFEEICRLPEYYPTRTELSILTNVCKELMEPFEDGDLVELGSGANWKICRLIDAARRGDGEGIRYIPVDVSESAMLRAAWELVTRFSRLRVLGIVGDFTADLCRLPEGRRKLITFFGSTIGNFNHREAHQVLRSVSDVMCPDDRFLIGLDMVKPVSILESAYNDTAGVTAEFNKNMLIVLNRELNATFDPDLFEHRAFFNEDEERIEMHLSATEEMTVEIRDLDLTVEFERGETIRTEISRKFTRESAEQLFSAADLAVECWFTDRRGWFSLVELVRK
ncbi:MAG: L-histidine N(alpha)-methyltransferase [Methanomicrobiaceae archaeon]|nr:L-histidine N(alpha)-methyltransferase [Methanomicrobiaceae archaeon]